MIERERNQLMPNLPPMHRPRHLGPRKQAEAKRQRELSDKRGFRELKTSRWQRARARFLGQAENALCVCCKANGRTAAASLVDHIVPHHGDTALIYDTDNMQPLCRWCHEHIKKPIEIACAKGEASTEDLRLNRPFPEHFGG
jgi:5-methylcytosine-specific restriction endonuclease McrA